MKPTTLETLVANEITKIEMFRHENPNIISIDSNSNSISYRLRRVVSQIKSYLQKFI